MSNIINNNIKKIYRSADSKINQIKKEGDNAKKSVLRDIKKKQRDFQQKYKKMRWRGKRPDITLLAEMLMLLLFLILLMKGLPLFTSTKPPIYSKEQLELAMKLPKKDFSLAEIGKVKMEFQAIKDHKAYFTADPYHPEFSGQYELQRVNAMIPFISFAIMYVIPPFVVAYIIWFIIKYWYYVLRAAWGFFLMLKDYFTKKIQHKLGCKWYIKMVTGWGCRSENFSRYFNPWRRRYVDIPVHREQLRYMRKYYWAKRVYYEVPYRKYILLPLERLKIKLEFSKKLYIQRAYEVFMRKLLGTYDPYYRHPRDELYRRLLNNNRNLAAAYAKVKQTQAQLEGKPYKSVSTCGRQCECPATDTPLKAIKNSLAKAAKKTVDVKDELNNMINETHKLYDKINKIPSPAKCKTYDELIEHRRPVAKWSLVAVISMVIVLYLWSAAFGMPAWLDQLFKNTSYYVVSSAGQFMYQGDSRAKWILLYLGLTCASLVAIWLV